MRPDIFFNTDTPIVYFGSTMLPNRMHPRLLRNLEVLSQEALVIDISSQ
jgi:hypothetical protein